MTSKLNELVMLCLLLGSPLLSLTSAPPALNDLFSCYLKKEKRKTLLLPLCTPETGCKSPKPHYHISEALLNSALWVFFAR